MAADSRELQIYLLFMGFRDGIEFHESKSYY